LKKSAVPARLLLEDGTEFSGYSFGYEKSCSGEVVFNTGMVGYPQSLTDPSYKGQILSLTYPLVGNYGVPGDELDQWGLPAHFESDRIQVTGLVVSEYCLEPSHFSSKRSLADWLRKQKVPAIGGVDTRALTERLRQSGVMKGKILVNEKAVPFEEVTMPVAKVSCAERRVYEGGELRILLVDCGAKNNILRCLLDRKATVIRAPWDYDYSKEDYDGLFLSNGPGDPKQCTAAIGHLRGALDQDRPIFGICLGNQIMALAAGADTYKLKFGHRGQNQPCVEVGTSRCYITSQNHGYAVREDSLPSHWEPWFVNANDGTNEGIRHASKPFSAVQFHPEAWPGPHDTEFLFDRFLESVRSYKAKKGGKK
jgi:carbamoyl-phosphate synthase small subunit